MTFPCPTPLIMPTKPNILIGAMPLQTLSKIAQKSFGLTRCPWPTLGASQAHHHNHYRRHPHTGSVQSCTTQGALPRRTKTAKRNDKSLGCAKLHRYRRISWVVQNCTDERFEWGLRKIAQEPVGLTRCPCTALRTAPANDHNHYQRHHPTGSMQNSVAPGPLSRHAKINDRSVTCAILHNRRHVFWAVQNCTRGRAHMWLCKIAQKLSGLPSPWVTESRESEQGSFAALSHFWSPARGIEAAFIPRKDTCDWRCAMI